MKLPRGLTARVLTVSLLAALLTIPIVIVPVAQWVAQFSIRRTFGTSHLLVESLAEQCRERPASWTLNIDGSTVYAYDRDTQASSNPAAPSLDAQLFDRLRSGEDMPSRLRWTPPFGGRILVSTGETGPCSLLSISWRPTGDAQNMHTRLMISILILVVFLSGLFAILIAIRPLLIRISALDRAAAHIGDADEFSPIQDTTDDALGRLAARIADSHERIVAANEALKQRATALEEHLADVAHDVRTPLAALQLRLEQLAGDKSTSAPQLSARREQVMASLEDVVYLTSLIENLRLATRLQEQLGTVSRTMEIDLGRIVCRVVARFDALGAMRAVRVRGSWPEKPVTVRCDPAAAEQALTNLVQNAVVYGHAGGSVTVVLDRVQRGFELSVIDDGPGVPPNALPRLAERRFRGDDARSRGPTGSGLGLAIVAEVCARHDWTLDFERREPQGLAVIVRGSMG